MSRVAVNPDADAQELQARLRCDVLCAPPAVEGGDTSPVTVEATRRHEAAQAFRDRLVSEGFRWTQIEPKLAEFLAEYPTPILDATRRTK